MKCCTCGQASGITHEHATCNARRSCIVSDFGGELPIEREQLEDLPGIGRSTAAAILALAQRAA